MSFAFSAAATACVTSSHCGVRSIRIPRGRRTEAVGHHAQSVLSPPIRIDRPLARVDVADQLQEHRVKRRGIGAGVRLDRRVLERQAEESRAGSRDALVERRSSRSCGGGAGVEATRRRARGTASTITPVTRPPTRRHRPCPRAIGLSRRDRQQRRARGGQRERVTARGRLQRGRLRRAGELAGAGLCAEALAADRDPGLRRDRRRRISSSVAVLGSGRRLDVRRPASWRVLLLITTTRVVPIGPERGPASTAGRRRPGRSARSLEPGGVAWANISSP